MSVYNVSYLQGEESFFLENLACCLLLLICSLRAVVVLCVVDDCMKRVVGGADIVGVQGCTWETGTTWRAGAWQICCWYKSHSHGESGGIAVVVVVGWESGLL